MASHAFAACATRWKACWNGWPASGMTTEEVLEDYEDLEREDILAALSYAARLARVNLRQSLAV